MKRKKISFNSTIVLHAILEHQGIEHSFDFLLTLPVPPDHVVVELQRAALEDRALGAVRVLKHRIAAVAR